MNRSNVPMAGCATSVTAPGAKTQAFESSENLSTLLKGLKLSRVLDAQLHERELAKIIFIKKLTICAGSVDKLDG
jgi:hypothetical protein